MMPPEQRADEIAQVVSEARLATLQLEARAALELARKTLAVVQGTSIDLETLEDIILAQEYRLNIWPTPKPAEELEIRQHLVLKFDHERQPDDEGPCIELQHLDALQEPRPRVVNQTEKQDLKNAEDVNRSTKDLRSRETDAENFLQKSCVRNDEILRSTSVEGQITQTNWRKLN